MLERTSENSGRLLRSQRGLFRSQFFLDSRGSSVYTSEISGRILRFQRGILRSQGGILDDREIPDIQADPSEISGMVLRYQGGF